MTRVLRRAAGASALAVGLFLLAVLWLLPAMGRRGDLNSLIEDGIRSLLAVPVKIANVETDALSEFSITRIESLRVEAGRGLRFGCDRLSLFYRPLELLGGRVRELTARNPSLFMDLDEEEDAPRVLRSSERPESASPDGATPAGASPEAPAYRVDRFRIEGGRLSVRTGGRILVIENLRLDASGVGGTGDIGWEIHARCLGGRLSGRGHLMRSGVAGDSALRYRLAAATLEIEDLPIEPLLASLLPDGFHGDGRLSLSGSAEGIWPDEVRVRMTSRLAEARSRVAGAQGWNGGEGVLDISAVARDGLDRVEFQVRLDAEANREELPEGSAGPLEREKLSFRGRGEFARKGAGETGPWVAIESAEVDIPRLGKIRASGRVGFDAEDVALDLDLRAEGVSPARLRRMGGAFFPARVAHQLPAGFDGRLNCWAHVSGGVRRWEAAAGLSPSPVSYESGNGDRVTAVAGGVVDRLTVAENGLRLEGVRISLLDLDAGDLVRAAAVDCPDAVQLRGRIALDLNAAELTLPVEEVEAQIDAKLCEGALAAEGIGLFVPSFEAYGSARVYGERETGLLVRFESLLEADELAIGPVVETLAGKGVRLSGETEIQTNAVGFVAQSDWRFEAATTGPVDLRGTIGLDAGEDLLLDVAVEASEIPADRFLAICLRDAFKERFSPLEGSRFEGECSLEAALKGPAGDPAVAGRFRARKLAADLAGASFEGVSLDLPFGFGRGIFGAEDAAGLLDIERASVRSVPLGRLRLPFSLSRGPVQNSYRLGGAPVRMDLLGGVVELRSLDLRPFAAAGERLRLSLEGRELHLDRAAALLGIPELPGRISIDVRSLRFSPERLDISGGLAIDVLGGRAEVEGLAIDHPGEPYRQFSVERASVRELDLGEIGRRFRFGVLSGILSGEVRRLVFSRDAVSRFEAEFETVPRPGVPQFLNKAAVESIRRTLAGPFGALEEMFFSRFRFAGLGFRSSLDGGRFRLEGKYRFGGVEYIVYSRWYQFPRVDVINTNPGIDYDWETIYENLKENYFRGGGEERPTSR